MPFVYIDVSQKKKLKKKNEGNVVSDFKIKIRVWSTISKERILRLIFTK